jgi:hypothetical protein
MSSLVADGAAEEEAADEVEAVAAEHARVADIPAADALPAVDTQAERDRARQ